MKNYIEPSYSKRSRYDTYLQIYIMISDDLLDIEYRSLA